MAKVDMGRSRFKIQRRIGVELPGLGKAGALERKPYGPGVHGMKRKKLSDFTIRLVEKQKVVFHYGVREKQVINYVKKCKKDKSRAWVDSLIISLECRLDSIVFRANWTPSIPASRQMITHGHVMVNGKKVSSPSSAVKVGDVITMKDHSFKTNNFLQAKARPRLSAVPAFLNVEQKGEKEEITVASFPLAEDVPFEFEKRLVTEYYWKI